MVLIGFYAAAVGFEIEYWKLPDNSHVKNISIMAC
jgi:putative membrane protein